MRIFLIGYMGSGKSKTAESLSKLLNYPVLEMDSEIEKQEGMTVSKIFQTQGQEWFREKEKQVLHSIVSFENIIVSTGGGTPCYFDNMDWMNEHGLTVYLEANAGLLFHRLASNKKGRPLIEDLSDVDLMEQITGHLIHRIPFYKKAKITFPASDMNVKRLAEVILNSKL